MAYQTFEELGLRFIQRPHESIRREPLDVPSAWKGPDMARQNDWIHRLGPSEADELDRALAQVREQGLDLTTLTRERFPLPTLGPWLREQARELEDGRGFVLIRGIPVDRYTEEDASLVYWGIGQHLGTPGEQNRERELLGHVRDTGEKATNPYVRYYRTADRIAFHVDLSDAVGLLCLQPARSGGESRIVSSVAVYNEFLRRRPDLVDVLYETFWLDRRGEHRPEENPVVPVQLCRYAGGQLSTFFHSDYLRSAERHPEVRLSDRQREALDLYEDIANSPDFCLDMEFRPGDIQLLSNHRILHARNAYEDFDEPERQRHLLRLWISLHGHDLPGTTTHQGGTA